MTTEKYECPVCGSKYEITKHKIIMRDKDSIECDICNHPIISWNGGVMYSSKLLERNEKHKKGTWKSNFMITKFVLLQKTLKKLVNSTTFLTKLIAHHQDLPLKASHS